MTTRREFLSSMAVAGLASQPVFRESAMRSLFNANAIAGDYYQERQRLVSVEAERLALKEMYLVPVVWFRSHLAVQPGVQGFVLDPMGRYDAATLQVAP